MQKKQRSPFGSFLRNYRMVSGIYIKDLALALGYAKNYLLDIENGIENIPEDLESELLKVCPFTEAQKERLHQSILDTRKDEEADRAMTELIADEMDGIKHPDVGYELEDGGAWKPYRAHANDAGADLTCNEDAILTTSSPTVVRTGVRVLIPRGYVGLICPRSGFTQRGIVAEIGVIDADFTGEIKVTMRLNDSYLKGDEAVNVKSCIITRGTRIAQILIMPVAYPVLVPMDVKNTKTDRGQNGYGSTGVEGKEDK